MKFRKQAILLTAESTPYEINGKSGTSHKIRFLIDNEIYPMKATEEQVRACKEAEGMSGTVEFFITSRKENLKVTFVEFEQV